MHMIITGSITLRACFLFLKKQYSCGLYLIAYLNLNQIIVVLLLLPLSLRQPDHVLFPQGNNWQPHEKPEFIHSFSQ